MATTVMSDKELVNLLHEARELCTFITRRGGGSFGSYAEVMVEAERLQPRIDAALEAHREIEWQQVSPTTQEAVVVQPDTFNVAVECMVLSDGNVGWWGKYKGSTIGCFDTEEEAKAACLKAVKDVAECFEKIAKRNKRLK